MNTHAMLTIAEVARESRCSVSHVYRILAGKFPDLPPLTTTPLGRRRFIRRETLRQWLLLVERQERDRQYASGLSVHRIDDDLEYLAGA